MSAEENNTLVLFFPERLEASSPLKELLVYIDSICNKKLENRIFYILFDSHSTNVDGIFHCIYSDLLIFHK